MITLTLCWISVKTRADLYVLLAMISYSTLINHGRRLVKLPRVFIIPHCLIIDRVSIIVIIE